MAQQKPGEKAGKTHPLRIDGVDVPGSRGRIGMAVLLCGDMTDVESIGYLPLLAPARSAFVRKTESLVGHGSASFEELIVPLVQVARRDT